MKKETIISKDRYKKRISTCLDCEFYSESLNRCKKCGCFLLIKAALRDTKCPINKWAETELSAK